jgi:hypothetical protein
MPKMRAVRVAHAHWESFCRGEGEQGCNIYAFAFLLAAQRAFMSCESLFLPAAVIPPFLFAVEVRPILPFCRAHRALIAAAIFARA